MKTGTVIICFDALIDSEIGEGGYVLRVVEHCISEFPYVVEDCPKTSDEGCLEPASRLRHLAFVEGHFFLCHEVAPTIGYTALEEVSPSDSGMIIVGLLKCIVAIACGSWHFIRFAAEESAYTRTDREPHIQRNLNPLE